MGTGADLLNLNGRSVTMLRAFVIDRAMKSRRDNLARIYIEVAKKTCSLLDQIKSFLIGVDVREAIRRQRVKEKEAQEVYEIARNNLFDAARWG